MTRRVHIKDIAWVAVWDEARGRHAYAHDCDIVFEDNTILHVGAKWTGEADEVVDGRGRFVMPGLVNIHCHSRSGPFGKGIIEEVGTPTFWMSGLYDSKAAFWRGSMLPNDEKTPPACSRIAFYELLLGGVTTVLDQSMPYADWIDVVEESGLRAVVGPWYASADWATRNGHELEYVWDNELGRRRFDHAIKVIEQVNVHPSGRMSGILSPDTLDTTEEELLRDSLALADERGWLLSIHCAESMVEFHEFTRRSGKTPVQYAKNMGVLRPGTILGHCIYLDTHSWPHWHTREDLRSLADSGVAVAHCPTPFSRYGVTMESLGAYIAAGVTMGIGTDTFPHSMLDEMRLALTLSRVADEDMTRISTSDVFHAATVGGAKALGRTDIGRIAVGAKADLVSVDLAHPSMRPLRDPLRSMIYSASERPVRDVWIDGRQVVFDGKVPQIDIDGALSIVEEAQFRAEREVPNHDWARRTAEDISPLTLPRLTA